MEVLRTSYKAPPQHKGDYLTMGTANILTPTASLVTPPRPGHLTSLCPKWVETSKLTQLSGSRRS